MSYSLDGLVPRTFGLDVKVLQKKMCLSESSTLYFRMDLGISRRRPRLLYRAMGASDYLKRMRNKG